MGPRAYVTLWSLTLKEKPPSDILKKYPYTTTLPKPTSERIELKDVVLVSDHSDGREYWKGFELVHWQNGVRELRCMYWTRRRGTKRWIWGEKSPIVSFERLTKLISMAKKKGWFA